MEAKEHWFLLIVDFLPVAAIVSALSKMMAHPPKSYAISGLPPVIVLPKKDISMKAMASIMSTAGGGPIPEEALHRMLGDRDVILCAEPRSLQSGITAMEKFYGLHRDWRTQKYGIQLFFITNRLYQDNHAEAIDFLEWLLAGIICYTSNTKTDIEIVTQLAEQIWNGTTGAGKEKAQQTADAIKRSGPELEPSIKILKAVSQNKSNQDRAVDILNVWIKKNVHPTICAEWAAANLGLYLTLQGGDFEGKIKDISSSLVQRIRDRKFATNLWVKQRSSVPAEKRAEIDNMIEEMKEKMTKEAMESLESIDEDEKIEETTDKPPKRR